MVTAKLFMQVTELSATITLHDIIVAELWLVETCSRVVYSRSLLAAEQGGRSD